MVTSVHRTAPSPGLFYGGMRLSDTSRKPLDAETPFDRLRAGGDTETRGKCRTQEETFDWASERLGEKKKGKPYPLAPVIPEITCPIV